MNKHKQQRPSGRQLWLWLWLLALALPAWQSALGAGTDVSSLCGTYSVEYAFKFLTDGYSQWDDYYYPEEGDSSYTIQIKAGEQPGTIVIPDFIWNNNSFSLVGTVDMGDGTITFEPQITMSNNGLDYWFFAYSTDQPNYVSTEDLSPVTASFDSENDEYSILMGDWSFGWDYSSLGEGYGVYPQFMGAVVFFTKVSGEDPGEDPGEDTVEVAAPVISPAMALFDESIEVSISAEEGLTVYYTLDGSQPTADALLYTGPFTLTKTTLVKAAAFDAEGNCSPVVTAEFKKRKHGIGEDFDPSSPPNPDGPSTVVKHKLVLAANPVIGGYIYSSGDLFEEGTEVWVEAEPKSDFKFVNWTLNGEVYNTNNEFMLTMPGEDLALVANFVYDPRNPADPDIALLSHPLTVVASPSFGGWFNFSSTSIQEGETEHVYAYANSDFRFKGWMVDGKDLGTDTNPLAVTMGQKPVSVTGLFEYAPSSPANPNANYWNPVTGQLIMDDFVTGSLYSAISQKIGSNNLDNVYSVIIKGCLGNSDLWCLSNFPNAASIDVTRVDGIEAIPSYGFYDVKATHIYLPACVGSVGNYAFYGCDNLTHLSLYATVPPTVNSDTFDNFGNMAGCTLHVPQDAMPLYREADGWKDFTEIMPLMEELHALQVSLPEECADGRYKHNRIELVNQVSGARQKYVVTDRLLYTFLGLQRDEMYTVLLLSPTGLTIGKIEDVLIPDMDSEVTFSNLKVMKEAAVAVSTPDGQDVTQQVTIEWYEPQADGTRTYLRNTAVLGEVPVGQQLVCSVTIPKALAMTYANPADNEFRVSDETSLFSIVLEPLRQVVLTGKVTDEDGSPVANANVSVTQKINGKYDKTLAARTSKDGSWQLNAYESPSTSVTYSASEYITTTRQHEAITDDQADLGEVALRSIVGARIDYSLSFTGAAKEGAEPDRQDVYDDYKNVDIKVYNVTRERQQNDVSVQYPQVVVIDETVEPGDVLRLTAVSKNSAFNDVETTVTVDEARKATAAFELTERGGLEAFYNDTDNDGVIAMLYSKEGNLVARSSYASYRSAFTRLADGDYTLVSIGNASVVNGLSRLSSLASLGLMENVDYVANALSIESGKTIEVLNQEIPAFDENRFSFTSTSSSFTGNKTTLQPGNYLTLKSTVDFKAAYKAGVSDVKMIYHLPQGCDLVEGSVMIGRDVVPYTAEDGQVTVPLGNSNYNGQIRFVVVPTQSGTLGVSASVSFAYDGRDVLQPLGNVVCEVAALALNCASLTATPEIYVSGVAPAHAKVTVYDGDDVIGETKANAKGLWGANCTLHNPADYSTHTIWGLLATNEGGTFKSESQEVSYKKSAIVVSKITMVTAGRETVFDFLNPLETSHSYSWSTSAFTFIVELTNNDPEVIRDVTLYVYTSAGRTVRLYPTYDEKTGAWVAQGTFESGNAPVNVDATFLSLLPIEVDPDTANMIQDEVQAEVDELTAESEESERLFEEIEQGLADGSMDREEAFNKTEDFFTTYRVKVIRNKYYDPTDFERRYRNATNDEERRTIAEEERNRFYTDEITKETEGYRDVEDSLGKPINETLPGPSDNDVKIPDFVLRTNDPVIDEENRVHIPDANWRLDDKAFVDSDGQTLVVKNSSGDTMTADMSKTLTCADLTNGDAYTSWADRAINVAKNVGNTLSGGSLMISTWAAVTEKEVERVNRKLAFDYIFHNITKSYVSDAEFSANEKILRQGIKDAQRVEARHALAKGVSKGVLGKAMGGLGLANSVHSTVNSVKKGLSNHDRWMRLEDKIRELCKVEIIPTLLTEAQTHRKWIDKRSSIKAVGDLGTTVAGAVGTFGASVSCGTTLVLSGVSFIGSLGLSYWESNFLRDNECNYRNMLEKMRVECNYQDDPDECDCGLDCKCDKHTPFPDVVPVIDPSGFVYEAVPDNRVEGMQASVYYKEVVEDPLYPDLIENIVLWDAEEYAQKNPLFTDENGMYAWDVPQGLWQVKFEKDGYITTYSDWLPVPPPQLEVNIPIVQNQQPEVAEVHAYEDGVEITFNKYMDPESLTKHTIYLTAGGNYLQGEVSLCNAQVADPYAAPDAEGLQEYASVIRFVPEQKLAATSGEIRLNVSREVRSYAGIPMAANYSQVLDIEKEVKEIKAETDKIQVLYGGDRVVTVSVLPSDAGAGRSLTVKSTSPKIAFVAEDAVVLDENGQGSFEVNGLLPGTSELEFTITDSPVKGSADVNVVTELYAVEAPTASRASGSQVYRGTKIQLASEVKDATIYYTTDDADLYDPDGLRKKFTLPIEVNGPVSISAIAVTPAGEQSETAEFEYDLKQSLMYLDIPEGWSWISHNFDVPLPTSLFGDKEAVQRVMSQTTEAVRDPQLGLVGGLKSLEASQSYKVESSASVDRISLNDVEWNPATPIAVKKGWNWIGYPVSQVMTPEEAFANCQIQTGDLIVGLTSGFAQYNGEAWEGDLEVLSPGAGYMFLSADDKKISYQTGIVSNAASLHAPGLAAESPWAVDVHRYPQVMCLVASLVDSDNVPVDCSDYSLGAFVGDECRGIGKVVNDKYMLSIHGRIGDKVSFRIAKNGSEAEFALNDRFDFAENVIGNVNEPYMMRAEMTSGISHKGADAWEVYMLDDNLVIAGGDLDSLRRIAVIDSRGVCMHSTSSFAGRSLPVGRLQAGVYTVVIETVDNGYSYHKVMIK